MPQLDTYAFLSLSTYIAMMFYSWLWLWILVLSILKYSVEIAQRIQFYYAVWLIRQIASRAAFGTALRDQLWFKFCHQLLSYVLVLNSSNR